MQRALVLRIGFTKRRCKRGRIRIDNLNEGNAEGLLHDSLRGWVLLACLMLPSSYGDMLSYPMQLLKG